MESYVELKKRVNLKDRKKLRGSLEFHRGRSVKAVMSKTVSTLRLSSSFLFFFFFFVSPENTCLTFRHSAIFYINQICWLFVRSSNLYIYMDKSRTPAMYRYHRPPTWSISKANMHRYYRRVTTLLCASVMDRNLRSPTVPPFKMFNRIWTDCDTY